MTEKLEEKCTYAGDRDRTIKLIQNEPSLRWANEESIYSFCEGCKGYDTKCGFYYTK